MGGCWSPHRDCDICQGPAHHQYYLYINRLNLVKTASVQQGEPSNPATNPSKPVDVKAALINRTVGALIEQNQVHPHNILCFEPVATKEMPLSIVVTSQVKDQRYRQFIYSNVGTLFLDRRHI